MTDQAPIQDAKRISCSACGAEHPLAEMAREEEVKPDVIEVALLCPSCGHRSHACFDTPGLKAQRATVQKAMEVYRANRTVQNWRRYETARDVFRRNFDQVNKRWRRKLAVTKEQEQSDI